MEGMCVKDCHLLLFEQNGQKFRKIGKVFKIGQAVYIGTEKKNIGGNDFVELANPSDDWNFEHHWIKKRNLNEFFKRNPIEVIQCRWFEEIGTMNRFLLDIEPEKIVSCGASGNTLWVYYKTFVEKGWEE